MAELGSNAGQPRGVERQLQLGPRELIVAQAVADPARLVVDDQALALAPVAAPVDPIDAADQFEAALAVAAADHQRLAFNLGRVGRVG